MRSGSLNKAGDMHCYTVCVWLYTVFSVLADGHDICPNTLPCTCSVKHDNKVVVDCSSRGLQDLPAGIPQETTDLILSSNDLTVIRNNSFISLINLSLLDLGFNSISMMETGAFQGLDNLNTLLLNNNKLNALKGSYPPGVFHPLEQLSVLDIRNNVDCTENGEYISVSETFLQNNSLVELRLDVIQQRPLPDDLGYLTSLRTIHFQPDSGPHKRFCCFYNVTGFSLAALNRTQVETLVYRGCTLTNIEIDTFQNVSLLKTLLLEGTPLHPFMPYLAAAVLNSNIEKLYLNNTQVGDQLWFFIKGLQGSKIKSLMFDTDYIYNDYGKPASIKKYLPGLEELSVADNYISWTSDLTYDFLTAPNLRYLNMSWQQREHITFSEPQPQYLELLKTSGDAQEEITLNQKVPSLQGPVKDAQEINLVNDNSKLTNIHLKYMPEDHQAPSIQHPAEDMPRVNLVSDDLEFTNRDLKFKPAAKVNKHDYSNRERQQRIGSIHSASLGFHLCDIGTICPVVLPRYLELIDISHNGIHLPQIPNILIMNENNLKTLIMSHNRIAMLPKKMLCWHNITMNLETIDLSSNQINHMVPDLFGRCDFTAMKHFLFSVNLFGQMCTSGQDTCHFFDPMPYIETLDLSSNEIHQLPSTFLSPHNNMRKLDLTNNSLSDISFNIYHMYNLELLDLTLNKLTCVSERVMDMMNKAPNGTIRLVGNPLSCTCKCLPFIQWAFRNKGKLVDADLTVCTLKNNTRVTLSNIDNIKQYLEESCVELDWAWLIAVAFFAYCLLITLVSLIIRFQWELRYSIYRLRLRMGRYETSTLEGPFRYDAFMAFHESDFPWVYYKAISSLEKKAKLKLCVHKRDFLPGNAIVDNICDALNASKKIVLLMTDSFLQSGWCQFEFKMAHSMSIDRGRNILIFVILKKLHKRKITPEVMHILNAYTYLEWEEDVLREGQFWTRLEEAIREQPPSVISS